MTADLNKDLAEVLRDLRRNSKESSQLLFSIAVGLSRSYISDIERMESSPTVRVLFRIANELKMPLSEIIRRAEEWAYNKKQIKV